MIDAKNKPQLIKGIIFISEDSIPSSSFSDLEGDGYIKLDDNVYMYIWHNNNSHQSIMMNTENQYNIKNVQCFAISESNGELDVNDINRVFSGEYSAYKSTMIAKSKKYFRDSFKKEIKMDIKQFNKIKDKAKRTNKSFVASMKTKDDLTSDVDIKVVEDAIYWVKRDGKPLTIKNVFRQIDRDMKGFYNEEKKKDIIEYLKRKYNLRDSIKDSKVYIFKVKSTYGGDEGQRYFNIIKADSIVNAWEKWKDLHSPGWANYLITEVRTDGGDYYPHLFGLPTSVDKKIKSTKWSAGDSIKDVEPNKDESKEEFIARFMNETKSEYPNEKQRYAVANSYWKKAKDSKIKDGDLKQISKDEWMYKGVTIEYNSYGKPPYYFVSSPDKFSWMYSAVGLKDLMKAIDRELVNPTKDSIRDSMNYKGYEIGETDWNSKNGWGAKIVITKNGVIVGGAKSYEDAKNKIDNMKKPEDLYYKDSINDEDITELSQEEMRAIEDYKKAISNTKDVKLLNLYSHILKEEIEHLEELNNAKSEVGDSVKDKESAKVREYISILEGKIAKKEGYILKPNMILLGDNKTQFPITTQVYQRLIELGY